MQFWTNPLAELHELQRVLKPGGSIALFVLFAGPGRSWKVILLPSTIALGTTISTSAIWGKSNHRRHDFLLPSEHLVELKQRIENLEEIAASNTISVGDSLIQLDRESI